MTTEVEDIGALVEHLRATADKLESEDYGGLTGVVLVLEGVPGTFVEDEPLVGTWVPMKGGRRLYGALLKAALHLASLRKFREEQTQ